MSHYKHLRKDFLIYFDDSNTHGSLIGSTISIVSKKDAPYASKMSSRSILTLNTELSKISAK
jgi:hypothetical protein